MFKQKAIHYPNLKTILMIEVFLQKRKKPLSKNEILERIPKKIMRPTLNIILEYLEASGKTISTKKGTRWIYDDNKKFDRTLRKISEDIF
ncbi:MAG: hypothetical protein ABIB47_03050 [Candidatus Woesearchaeota archaeon]